MARRKHKKQEETIIDIVEARDSVQAFFEDYQNYIIGVVAGLLLIAGGYFAYRNLYLKPRQDEAVEQMFRAQYQFERDSFALALNNPGGGYPGFIQVMEDYGGTKAGNSARYYAGICYLHLGRYEDALEYLKKFKPAGEILPIMKFGALGDAHSELNDMSKAESMYRKAVSTKPNDFLTPYYLKKLAMLQQKQGKTEESLETFRRIKEDYPNSLEAQDIEKYITRLESR